MNTVVGTVPVKYVVDWQGLESVDLWSAQHHHVASTLPVTAIL